MVVGIVAVSLLLGGCAVYPAPYYQTYPGYPTGGYTESVYYQLPPGYRYEYWSSGPVIIDIATGAIVTYAMLRTLYPHWHWYRDYHPRFYRDWRIPAHRAHWHHYGPQRHYEPRQHMHGGYYHQPRYNRPRYEGSSMRHDYNRSTIRQEYRPQYNGGGIRPAHQYHQNYRQYRSNYNQYGGNHGYGGHSHHRR